MGHNDHIDFELYEAIEDLAEVGELEENTPAFGIAQQVVHQGYESLSLKQRIVYDTVVIPVLKRRGEQLKIDQIIISNPD